jgi:hypothetical protein
VRYRKLSPDGDYVFGQGSQNFYIDVVEAVGQAIKTRLGLATGEWFLDITEGTPYSTQILGKNTDSLYDAAIQSRILGTEGVTNLAGYNSNLNRDTRVLEVSATVDTIYGEPVTFQTSLAVP